MLRNKKSYDLLRDCVSRLADHRILFPWFLLIGVKYNSNIKNKKWVFTVQFYNSSGLLVSFFIVVISWRYFFPSSECFIRRMAVNILYLIKRPVLSS